MSRKKIDQLTRRDFLKKASIGTLGSIAVGPSMKQFNDDLDGTGSNPHITLWDIFSDEFSQNCLAWHHNSHNSVIPASGNSWKKYWTANPDYLKFKGRHLLYYRGNGIMPHSDGKRHDRIAVAKINQITLNSFQYEDLNNGEFIINIGKRGSYDDGAVLDPAAIVINNKVYLYYSAIGRGPDSVGLGISEDGIHFTKYGKIIKGRAPSIIEKGGIFYMIYQIKKPHVGYVGFFLATSKDGKHFKKESDDPVFKTQEKGSWDNQIATGRLFKQANNFFLFYGGNPTLVDQPDYFGLARSRDLIHWERHPGNPIFGCGPKGSEDGGAIWFPALINNSDYYHILYEGSRGNYSWQLSSQVCMASIKKEKL